MLKAPKEIVLRIKEYDKRLSFRWNNRSKYWEIWYLTPWGDRIITPVVEGAYKLGGDPFRFVPLDNRVIDWLYRSDGNRACRNWKGIGRKKFNDRAEVKKRKNSAHLVNIAKDNYNVVNSELINPELAPMSNWLKPDIESTSRGRIMHRSAENAKEYFNDSP